MTLAGLPRGDNYGCYSHAHKRPVLSDTHLAICFSNITGQQSASSEIHSALERVVKSQHIPELCMDLLSPVPSPYRLLRCSSSGRGLQEYRLP